jgi:hypothetical protein
LHCWSDVGKSNVKSTDGPVALQLLLAIGSPTIKMGDVPPEPNAVASDIVRRNCVLFQNGNCGIVYEPLPLLKAEAGTDIFCGTLKT